MQYLIYTQNGWLTTSGNFHSDWQQAATYTREAAVEMCKAHVNYYKEMLWLPVQRMDVEEVAQP